MKTLLPLLHLIGSVGTTVPTVLSNNQYQNSAQKTTNRITTDWIKANPTFPPNQIDYTLPKNATEIELADFELTVEASLRWNTSVTATIKKNITIFNETEKKEIGKKYQEDKSIYFTTEAAVVGQPEDWKIWLQFKLSQLGWAFTETSNNTMTDPSKPEATIRTVDVKMKFSYIIPLQQTHVIHFNQQVIQTIRFGSQSGSGMPAQWDIDVWLPVQPRLLFRWMDYADTWEAFINNYATIRLVPGNSNIPTYAITQWDQDSSSGVFPTVNTGNITDQPNEGVTLAHSSAAVTHGDQSVSIGILMDIYREGQNIFATFEMTSISTFTDADNCQPGASGSAFIGDIEIE